MGAKILSMAFMVLFVIFSLAPGDGVAFSQDQGGGRPAPPMSAVSGKAVETMDSGGYTYVLLEKEGEKKWAAIPRMNVTVGEELILKPGLVMSNFKSKSLNRTFETIIFSAGPVR